MAVEVGNFDSKIFNPQAFGNYVKRIPDVIKTELANSGAIGMNDQASQALRSQTGSVYARVPYFGLITADDTQNNDGATDITSKTTKTYSQGFVVASRMNGWTERSFSKNITAGVDFMDNVATQISKYQSKLEQKIILSMLKGIFKMDTSSKKYNKEFLDNHTYDISFDNVSLGKIQAYSLNEALQKAGGDNKDIFKLVIMHSRVATNLENKQLLDYLTYTDANGITRKLNIGTWNGRTVLIDDNMPTEKSTKGYIRVSANTPGAQKVVESGPKDSSEIAKSSATPLKGKGSSVVLKEGDYVLEMPVETLYTTYILGENSIILDDIGDSVPYEMYRDPAKNGGQDTLYVRNRYICGFEGISFDGSTVQVSAKDSDLEAGTNWNVINNGESDYLAHKAIPISRIISRG